MAECRSNDRDPRSTRSSGAPARAGRAILLAEARGSLIIAGCVLALVAGLCAALLLCLNPAPAAAIPTELGSVELNSHLQAEVDSLAVQAAGVQADIDALDDQLEGYTENFNRMQVRLTEINQQIITLRRELQAAQTDHAYRVKRFETRICALYKSTESDEFLSILLASDGVGDLIQRIRLIATLADQDKRVVDNLSESTDKLNDLLRRIDKTKAEELALRKQIDGEKTRIETALAEREAKLAGLDGQIAAIIEAEKQRRQDERGRLQRALAAMLNGTQIYDGALPRTPGEIANQFLETCAYYIGIPYVWAGSRPSTGFDCSGYTAYVYAQHGVSLPHYSGYQAQLGYPVEYEDMQPGDLLAFGNPVSHVGIYVGDGLFVHAPRTGDVVSIWELSWKNNLSAIRRFDLQPRVGAPAIW